MNHFYAMQNAFRAKAMEFHPDQNQDNKGEDGQALTRIL